MTSPTPRQPDAAPELRRDAREVIQAVQAAFSGVVRSLPTRVGRPIQLSEALGLHRKLGWQLWKIVKSADPYEASQYLPGPTGVRSFLEAATRLGVPPPIIAAARDAAGRIDQLVTTHAGDRSTLDMMLGSLAGSGARQVEELRRRDAYRGNAFIWGVQVRTLSCTSIVSAGDGDTLDTTILHGLIDFRRVRPDALCALADPAIHNPGADGSADGEPLAPKDGPLPPPLIPEFCTTPHPGVRHARAMDGLPVLELDESPLGETGAITCRTGRRFRNVGSRRRRSGEPTSTFCASVRQPAEMLVHDLFLHRELFGAVEPEGFVVADIAVPPRSAVPLHERPRLPVTIGVQRLGAGVDAAETRDIPRYGELLRWTFDRLARPADEFDLYRIRLKYPVLPSSVVIGIDLPG